MCTGYDSSSNIAIKMTFVAVNNFEPATKPRILCTLQPALLPEAPSVL
jgi:hypothetical protein